MSQEADPNKVVLDTSTDGFVCEFCGGDIYPNQPVNFVHARNEAGEQVEYPFHPECWPNWRMVQS
jgi:hypothetical protein